MGSGCDPPKLRIVIDVGHTPEAAGALSARGVYEYEFNLRLATQVRNALVAAGFTSTYLMRMKGARRNLEQRADRANKMGADLFVSIHHDSVQDMYLRTSEALALGEKLFGEEHPDAGQWLNNFANLLLNTGRYAEAEPLYRRSIEIGTKSLGRDHVRVATRLKRSSNHWLR